MKGAAFVHSGRRLASAGHVNTGNTANLDTGFRFAKEGPVSVFYWVDGRFGYALSAGIDSGELARVATAVHDQLEHK
jgi:anti-sigma factor RsiW